MKRFYLWLVGVGFCCVGMAMAPSQYREWFVAAFYSIGIALMICATLGKGWEE